MSICTHVFQRAIFTRKLGQTDLVFDVQSGFISSLCMQDHKSLCVAVTSCTTLFNIQTHTHTYRQHFGQLI